MFRSVYVCTDYPRAAFQWYGAILLKDIWKVVGVDGRNVADLIWHFISCLSKLQFFAQRVLLVISVSIHQKHIRSFSVALKPKPEVIVHWPLWVPHSKFGVVYVEPKTQLPAVLTADWHDPHQAGTQMLVRQATSDASRLTWKQDISVCSLPTKHD